MEFEWNFESSKRGDKPFRSLRGPDTTEEEKRCCIACWARRGTLVRDDEPHGAWECPEARPERLRFESRFGAAPTLLCAMVRAQHNAEERWALVGALQSIMRRRDRCLRTDFPPRKPAAKAAAMGPARDARAGATARWGGRRGRQANTQGQTGGGGKVTRADARQRDPGPPPEWMTCEACKRDWRKALGRHGTHAGGTGCRRGRAGEM